MIVTVSGIRVPLDEEEKMLPKRLSDIFSLPTEAFFSLRVLKKSLDARRNRPPFFVYSLEVILPQGTLLPDAAEGEIKIRVGQGNLTIEGVKEEQSTPAGHRIIHAGAQKVIGADGSRHVDLRKLLQELGKRQMASCLVEGGAAIITSLLQEKLADRLVIIVAPKILGRGIEAVADLGNQAMDEAIKLNFRKVYRRGGDIIIDAIPAP